MNEYQELLLLSKRSISKCYHMREKVNAEKSGYDWPRAITHSIPKTFWTRNRQVGRPNSKLLTLANNFHYRIYPGSLPVAISFHRKNWKFSIWVNHLALIANCPFYMCYHLYGAFNHRQIKYTTINHTLIAIRWMFHIRRIYKSKAQN